MREDREPIAIVGIGCRFPEASGPAAFWDLLVNGRDVISEIPRDRFDVDALYDPAPAQPGKISTKWGGFLRGLDRFDAGFFGISPREADRLDPQQRLLLEVAWESLEDAGIPADALVGKSGSVFIGMWLNEYEARLFRDPARIDFYMTTGSGRYSASGRLSYVLGLQGPSVTLDCACSSSLVAVHLACRSLWSGETELALAGGANVILEPSITIAYSQSQMMAPDGRCKFGDARANGYVRSEGAAIVVLKSLARAVADGDRVYATIIGSAVNNDGRSSGFLATPGREGQQDMLRKAYRDAGVLPGDVQYVEAHGTGTHAGDPVEIQALGAVLADGRQPGSVCRIGSVKTNFGHTEGAAGVAGVIKVALSLKHGLIPPSLHFENPNPEIPWDTLPVRVQRQLEPWPDGSRQAIGGVSSFGIAGTNAHVVLASVAPPNAAPAHGEDGKRRVVPLSAQSPAALRDLAAAYARLARERADLSFADIAYTAAVRRTHLDERLAVVASDLGEFASRLEGWARDGAAVGVCGGRREQERTPKVAFVFPGQGAQWVGMGRELMRTEPAFLTAIEACDRAVRAVAGWSVIDELQASERASRLDRIDVIQPVLFAVQVALADLWRSWGVEPDAVAGHSMGEVAAACVANVLATEDAARVICERSRLMHRTSGRGAMALIGLSIDDTRRELAGRESELSIAVSNSPRSTVVSGDPAAVDALLGELERRDVFCRRIKVDVASHSPQMDPLREELVAAVRAIAPASGTVQMYSTVSGSRIEGRELGAQYWSRNLRQPVMFSAAVQQLIADGHHIFIEMSPHPLLTPALQELLQDAGRQGIVIGSTRRDEPEQPAILESLGSLYAQGYPVQWSRLYPAGSVVPVPTYQWQRERHWIDNAPPRAAATRRGRGAHPLLGTRLDGPVPTWESELSASVLREAGFSSCAGATLVGPGALMEIAAAAASAYRGAGRVELNDLWFGPSLPLDSDDDDSRRVVQTVIFDDGAHAVFKTFALTTSEPTREWTLLASGRIGREVEPASSVRPEWAARELEESISGETFYERLAARGIQVADRFKVISEVRRSSSEVLARIDLTRFPESASADALPPAAVEQAILALGPLNDDPSAIAVPIRTRTASRAGRLPAQGWAHATIARSPSAPLSADLTICDDAGIVFATVAGMELRPARAESYALAHRRATAEWHFEIAWEEPEQSNGPIRAVTTQDAGTWVILSDRAGVGARLRDALEARGESVVNVRGGERFEVSDGAYAVAPLSAPDHVRLAEHLRSAGLRAGRVVDLRGLDGAISPEDAVRGSADACAAAIVAHQAFRAASPEAPPRLWIVTRGAEPCGSEARLAIGASPLWGLGRVIALEQPDAFGGLIDLDAAEDPDEIERLANHLLDASAEKQAAFRAGRPFVPRLVRAAAPGGASVRIDRDATYLVTGGTGRLGLRVAKWLAECGAGHVVLTSRSGLPDRAEWPLIDPGSRAAGQVAAIREIEALGTRVTVVSADVADRTATRALIARAGAEWPRLKGVVHAAGIIEQCPIERLDAEQVAAVFHAKVGGAWELHEATRSLDLDFFALFSSASAAWGSRDLAHYAAANHFLDALAHERRSQGLPATSVSWGWWAEGGTSAAADQFFAQIGLSMMPADAALGVLGDLLATRSPQRVVAAVDWSTFKPVFEATGSRLLDRIEIAPRRAAAGARARGELRRAAEGRSGEDIDRLVLDHVRAQVADVLGREPAEADTTRGFFKMGMDSLMTVELRRRLEVAIDEPLPATIAFEYPTIATLSAFICRSILSAAPQTGDQPAAEAQAETGALAFEAALADRSADELASLLDRELGDILGDQGRLN